MDFCSALIFFHSWLKAAFAFKAGAAFFYVRDILENRLKNKF